MSEIELATSAVRDIEALLEERFGARGYDIQDKLSSVENEVPPEIMKRIRFVISVRDMLVAHRDAQMLSESDFVLTRNEALDWLSHHQTDRQPHQRSGFLLGGRGKLIVPVLVFVAIMSGLLLYVARSLEETHGSSEETFRLPQIK